MQERKLAIVDLSKGKVQTYTIPKSWRRGFLGGRGINSYLLYNLLEKGTDPFSPRNVFILGVGPLGGTLAPSSSRFSASALSPETGFLGDANCGGFFGPELRYAGFDHLVLRGKAKNPSYVNVQDGEIEIRDGRDYWGMDTYDVQKAFRKDLGDVESVVCGVAGENKVRFACLRTGVKNAAGRCGLGAVMGSKNVKAVVASGTDGIEVEHPEEMLEVVKDIKDYLMASKITPILGSMGTPLLYEISNTIGAIRTKNSQLNAWSDSLNAEELEKYVEKMISCSSCFMHCRHRNMFDGEGPEYTAVGLLGANLGLDDYPEVIKLNNTCNELGLDVSSSGTILSWAFELYKKGLIDKKMTGQELRFGDFELADELLHKISKREGFGDILAESSKAVKKFGPKSEDYLIAVKGLPQSDPHDVRYIKAFGLGIATASRGADHLRSRPTLEIFFRLPLEVKEKIYGKGVTADPTSYDGKEKAVYFSDNIFATIDSVGICKFICHGFNSPHFLSYEHFSKLLHAVTGMRFGEKELENIGKRIIDTERMFNFKHGMTAKDDTLPKRYFDDPMKLKVGKGHRIERKGFQKMKKRYYKLRNWNEQGRVKKQRVKQIESYGGLP
ncbi:MAG: aldehyde ferredoxin oxidoreductase family protein [Methanobacteriota archaeon]|nr:MAG: aldehyde ferredoxin oxidoreductase family protein [Euryarchaeota archaeon]